jgi:hypothetical protein
MASHTNMLYSVVMVHMRPVVTPHVHNMGQTGFEHTHAKKTGAAMRSKNSSQKHAATISVNCEVDYPCD